MRLQSRKKLDVNKTNEGCDLNPDEHNTRTP